MAVLDFRGHVAALESRKNWRPDDVIAFLQPFGVSVVACDRNPAPRFAKNLSAVFSARLFKPHRSLSVHEKNRYARCFACRNAHERDAYASAKKAFDVLASNKMRALDKRFGAASTDRLKALVLGGMRRDRAFALTRNPL